MSLSTSTCCDVVAISVFLLCGLSCPCDLHHNAAHWSAARSLSWSLEGFRRPPACRGEMNITSLEDVIQAAGDPVTLLRNLQAGPNVYPGVPPEFTNWRDETLAWQKTCVLFNQSYHMADLAVEGPDALRLLSHLGVNSFTGFVVDKAKQ